MPSTDSEHDVSAKVIETLLYFSMSQAKDISGLLQRTTVAHIHSRPRVMDAYVSQDHRLTAAFSYVSIVVSTTLSGTVIQASWRAMNSLQMELLWT